MTIEARARHCSEDQNLSFKVHPGEEVTDKIQDLSLTVVHHQDTQTAIVKTEDRAHLLKARLYEDSKDTFGQIVEDPTKITISSPQRVKLYDPSRCAFPIELTFTQNVTTQRDRHMAREKNGK